MPQRAKRFASPGVQGEDSWVEFRAPTRGEVKALDSELLWADLVVQRLVAWNWVDFDGQPLPRPASRDDLDRLTNAEVTFLVDACQDVFGVSPRAEDELKN